MGVVQDRSVAPGTTLGGCELLEEVGRGGMGIVFKARRPSPGGFVAVKLTRSPATGAHEQIRRLHREAQATSGWRHPNIVTTHRLGLDRGEHYLVMDLVDGPSLASLVQHPPLAPDRAAVYLREVAEAIHYAHEHGVLHGDLKPANILLASHDVPRVVDFGLARRLPDSRLPPGHLESPPSAWVLASPSFAPPEQVAAERERIGRPSDVYALGATLYWLLTGQAPFIAESLPKTLEQVLDRPAASPRLLNPRVPPDLAAVCLRCLAKEAARRYSTAKELALDLGRVLAGVPVSVRVGTV